MEAVKYFNSIALTRHRQVIPICQNYFFSQKHTKWETFEKLEN